MASRMIAMVVLAMVAAGAMAEVAADPAAPPEAPPTMDQRIEQLSRGGNAFAWDLYQRLGGDGSTNLFFSPDSIRIALAMTHAGARDGTREEITRTLHLGNDPDVHEAFGALMQRLTPRRVNDQAAYQLSVANALWVAQGYPLHEDYRRLVTTQYQAGIRNLDFAQSAQSARVINQWVEQQTQERIKDLVPPEALDALTRLVLTNAVYFKSQWAEQFPEHGTRPGPWHLAGGQTVEVPMMRNQARFGYFENDRVQVLEMPYQFGDLSMLVILPRQGVSLADLTKDLRAETFAQWIGGVRPRQVRVTFPKYRIESRFTLSAILRQMGMPSAFDPHRANFRGISPMAEREELFISEAIHKAFVEVDEQGTEAAAATAIIMRTLSAPVDEPQVFTADRPFLFVIRHNRTGSPMFMGRLSDPRAQQQQ